MRFFLTTLQALVVFFALLLVILKAHAEDSLNFKLILKPRQCAVLEEGDYCKTNVQINWESSVDGDFCVTEGPNNEVVLCWEGVRSGVVTKKYSVRKSKSFYLVDKKSNRVLSEQIFEVSWVYKNKSRSRLNWRVF